MRGNSGKTIAAGFAAWKDCQIADKKRAPEGALIVLLICYWLAVINVEITVVQQRVQILLTINDNTLR